MESNVQFLARMIVSTREGHQISSPDAQRLSDLATFGNSSFRSPARRNTSMPEERRAATSGFAPPETTGDVVKG